eukprot:11858239-Ditylum_brightwellii.AAC.1
MRKSYHEYSSGYAQAIESPDTFHITPMQIDTWNHIKGPCPKSSQVPAEVGYNKLLECPCIDHLDIEYGVIYVFSNTDACQ